MSAQGGETPGVYRRTRIKICGTTLAGDAEAAVAAGVDALGFIFVPKSARCISPESAQAIIAELPPFVDPVGVFVNQDLEMIVATVRSCRLAVVQLHGDEDPQFCRQLAQAVAPARLIKACRVRPDSQAADFAPYHDTVTGYLLDTYMKGLPGGTGKVFDWRLIDALNLRRPVILAGGLTVDNVAAAVLAVRPWAVDINSGIEISPGCKNHDKLRAVVAEVRAADCRAAAC